jgi:hypothetical protein
MPGPFLIQERKMISGNRLKAAENLPALSNESFQPSSRPTFGLKQIFVGPNGLRAGWRVLMFISLFAVLLGGFVLIRAGGPEAFIIGQDVRAHPKGWVALLVACVLMQPAMLWYGVAWLRCRKLAELNEITKILDEMSRNSVP